MKTNKIVSLILMVVGIVFFFIYLHFAEMDIQNQRGGYGAGIWVVAVGTFLTGAINLYNRD